MDPITIGLIGASALSGLAGAYSAYKGTKDANQTNIDLMREQRGWALEDIERANKYNSPLQQMQRLKEAGLNPNLVYGSGVNQQSATVRSTPPPTVQPNKIDTSSIADTIGLYQQLKMQKVQTDNIKAQTALSEKENLLKDAQIGQIGATTANTKFETYRSKQLLDMVIEKAKLSNMESKQDIELKKKGFDLQVSQYELNKLRTNTDVASTVLNMAQKRGLYEGQKLNQNQRNEMNEYNLRLMRQGMNPNDPMYARMLMQFLTKIADKYGWDIGQISWDNN